MEGLYRYILEQVKEGGISNKAATVLLKQLKKDEIRDKDIAITGIAVRLPSADSIEEFWDVLSNGINCIGEFPEDRKRDIERYLHFSKDDISEAGYTRGAFLSDIDTFDCDFFRIMAKEASLMDPSQRIFLQTAFEAVEDAGYGNNRLKGTETGVFVGYAGTLKDSYQKMIYELDTSLVSESIASNLGAIISGRLSYLFDLSGPAIVVDTACSSSLVAVHLACKAIINGECDQAIAGGIKLHTVPIDAEFSKMGIESSDGMTRAFDEYSDGAGIGEGAVAVFLKPLNAAIRDNDNIYAVIKGSAVNQDGTSVGITAPNPRAQADVIVKAWKDAGINPEEVQYIEAHGTGTALGDPIEILGLSKAFKRYTARSQFCAVGSLKTNIGHLYESSGIASLVKAVLSMTHKTMLPSICFDHPNEKIDFCNSPVYVNSALRAWKSSGRPRLCGINSFGFSGTNCHVVLQEAPVRAASRDIDEINVLTVSAQSEWSLSELLRAYAGYVSDAEDEDIHDICYTANTGRGHYAFRAAISFHDIRELEDKLSSLIEQSDSSGNSIGGAYRGYHKIVAEKYMDIDKGRITEEARGALSGEAAALLEAFVSKKSASEEDISLLCGLYVKGATVKWSQLYEGQSNFIVRNPSYQFEKKRCWLDFPAIPEEAQDTPADLFQLEWRESTGEEGLSANNFDAVFIINNDQNTLAEAIFDMLRGMCENVAMVIPAGIFRVDGRDRYFINSLRDDFEAVWEKFASCLRIKIIYMFEQSADESAEGQKRLENYYHLIESLQSFKERQLHIDVVLQNCHHVVAGEICVSINRAISAMTDELRIEYPDYVFRVFDIDGETGPDEVVNALITTSPNFVTAFRRGIRYLPILSKLDESSTAREDKKAAFTDGGVYVISGGLGEIALEVVKDVSRHYRAVFALLCRSPLPGRESWNGILSDTSDDSAAIRSRISSILEIEDNGCEVSMICCDVTDAHMTEQALSMIRSAYGKINGILHAAGIAGDSLFSSGRLSSFLSVTDPKIRGALNLEAASKDDALDFFISFSSVAALIPAPGQCSYSAANAFLDAFSTCGENRLTISWSTWKEVGMARRSGFLSETMFKLLPTKVCLNAFNAAIASRRPLVLIGIINKDKRYAARWRRAWFELDGEVGADLLHMDSVTAKKPEILGECRIMGRDDGAYSATEQQLAGVLARLLGFSEIYVFDNLFELGLDSILMVKVVNEISRVWNVEIKLQNFFEGASVEKLAAEIDASSVSGNTTALSGRAPDRGDEYAPFDLTEVQSAYLSGRSEVFSIGNISTHAYLEIETGLDIDLLGRAFRRVIEKHDMLKAVITGDARQRILADVPAYEISCEDLRYSENPEKTILDERERMSHRMFDPTVWPLFEIKAYRLSDEKCLLLLDFDMIVADAASLQIIARDLADFYQNEALEYAPFSYSLRDYIEDYAALKKSDHYVNDREYWLSQLEDFPEAPALPLVRSPEAITLPHFSRLRHMFPSRWWERLKELSSEYGVTASAFICAAFSEVLALWSNQKRFALNLATFNRYAFHSDVERLVGDFTSLLLLDVDMEASYDFKKKLTGLQSKIFEALDHRRYEGVEFLREIAKNRGMKTQAVMPVVFTSMIYHDDVDFFGRLGKRTYGISQTSQVYLDCQVTNSADGLEIVWDYVDQLFDPALIAKMFDGLIGLLNRLLENRDGIALPDCDKAVWQDYNATGADIPDMTLTGLFEDAAARYPDNSAVIFGESSITYAELDRRSNQVARYLLSLEARPGELIGLEGQRQIETIVNILGILKARKVYVPIDPSYPQERIDYILDHSNVETVLRPGAYEEHRLSELSPEPPGLMRAPEELAYVIYTSGSTGRPKGVMISHMSAANTIQDINNKFDVMQSDRIAGISSMCFDLSVYDIFGAFSAGAALVLVEDQHDIGRLLNTVRQNGVTIWNSVPSILELCLNTKDATTMLKGVRLVMLSGDWIPLTLFEKIKENIPTAEVFSLGGATEAAIWSIYYPIKRIEEEWKSIPYGIPMANQTVYLLNYRQELCPLEVQGEIYIGGKGVAEGYCNNPELTERAFIRHPLLGRLYCTGDYGVMHNVAGKGVIEFQGRKDFQVKIRGYRVELGEIEKCIMRLEHIVNAVVLDTKDENGETLLCAYIVASQPVDEKEIREELARSVPAYMIPAQFVFVEALSYNANGKVDRKALQALRPVMAAREEYLAPRNDIEAYLVGIFEEELGRGGIGVADDFFKLGISSVSMIRLVDKVCQRYTTVEVKFKEVLEKSCIAEVSEMIEQKLRQEGGEGLESVPAWEYNSGSQYYWQPTVQFRIHEGSVFIRGRQYAPIGTQAFLDIYSSAQNGVTIDRLIELASLDERDNAARFVQALVDDKVLIRSIPSPHELLRNIELPMYSVYGEELQIDAEKSRAFKLEQLNRRVESGFEEVVPLRDDIDLPPEIFGRRSLRAFDNEKSIPFSDFSRMVSTLRQIGSEGEIRYFYPSAGGLYPIDTYLYVKEGRVENVAEGLYYFCPIDNRLYLIDGESRITDAYHKHTNKSIFNASAFSAFFVYNTSVNMPKYKAEGYLYASIDVGCLISTFTAVAESSNAAVCSIGDMFFDKLAGPLRLSEKQVWIHTIEVGLKRKTTEVEPQGSDML